jgi:hypothetical protein
VIVSDHWAWLNETWSVLAIDGIRGAPRLLTIAAIMHANIRAGIRNHGEVPVVLW